MRRVMEATPLDPVHLVDCDSLSGYGPMTSTNRHVPLRRDAWWCGEGRLITAPYPIMYLCVRCSRY